MSRYAQGRRGRYCKHVVATCLCMVIVSACTETGEARNPNVTVDTLPSGGVLVSNSRAGSWDAGRNWIVRERARIGQVGGDGPDVLGRVSGLAIGSDDVVHVFDGFARELRSFGVDGRLITVRGRRGGGPNEFESVVAVSMAPDESLWLVDAGNGRYARLQPDGTFQTVPRPIATYNLPWLGGWDANRRFYDQASVVSESLATPVLVRMSAPGTPIDTVRLPAISLRQPGLGSMSFPLPFAPRQLWAFDGSAGRIWSALDTSYEITAIDLAGDTVVIVRRDHDRLSLGPVQRDSVTQYVRSLTTRFGVQVSSDMIPDVAPLIRWISVDDRGFLWVCATGLAPCDAVDVFDPRGVYMGSVALPVPASGRAVVRGNLIAFPAQGEYDTPMIIVGDISGRDSL